MARPLAFLTATAVLILCLPAYAEQPIFDEMPRWRGGWGFQILEEYRRESALLSGGNEVQGDFTEDVHLLHVQGVYTWQKEVRATIKVPVVVHAERTVPGHDGIVRQTDRGLGDPTIALPLKSYFNLDGRSGSWTFAPQVRIPTAAADEYDVYDRVFGAGAGFGYETETYDYHVGVSASTWLYTDRDEPMEVYLNGSLGLNFQAFGGSGHFKIKTLVKQDLDSELTVTAGPLLYWRFTDLVHAQLKYSIDVYDRQAGTDHGRGDAFRAGIGFVF